MKTISKLTETKNIYINVLVLTILLFISLTLVAVAIDCFSDLDALNKAF